jgi:polyhydroxyalkanoate synthesis regulator phasin
MLDLVRRYVDSLAGISEVPRDRAEKLVRELAKRGEVRVRDIQRTTQELVDRSLRNRQELVRLIQKEIKRQVASLGVASREDVDKLAKRVKDLERTGRRATGSSGAGSSAPKRTTKSKRPVGDGGSSGR